MTEKIQVSESYRSEAIVLNCLAYHPTDADFWDAVAELKQEHFGDQELKKQFGIMLKAREEGRVWGPMDFPILTTISDQPFELPSSFQLNDHAKRILKDHRGRQANQIASKIAKAQGDHKKLMKAIDELSSLVYESADQLPILPTADDILSTVFPEPIWAVPTMLPSGLTIFAGKAKIGKSWMMLQLAYALACGGNFLGQEIPAMNVLLMALEDNPRRLQDRMKKQNWPKGLPVHIMYNHTFRQVIGSFANPDGIRKLMRYVESLDLDVVLCDTLSTAMVGVDQKEKHTLTGHLQPIQEFSLDKDKQFMMVDHHPKNVNQDVLNDIYGTQAKGAIADTAWGIYSMSGIGAHKLGIIGRDVDQQNLRIKFDPGTTWAWHLEGDNEVLSLGERQEEILEVVIEEGPVSCTEISKIAELDYSQTYRVLKRLVQLNQIQKQDDKKYSILG